MFRDMFCHLYAPIAYGRVKIDFWQLLDLTDFQKRWLASMPDELSRFTDQAMDIMDFGFGWHEFGHNRAINDRGKELIWRAHTQLEAAAATAVNAYDLGGSLQSALLGTELALKAGLAAHGISDQDLKRKFGHNLIAAAAQLAIFEPNFDMDRVSRVVSTFPDFVASRYDIPPPSRIETGHILMGAQYVGSEVTRQFSDRNCRADSTLSAPRAYPA